MDQAPVADLNDRTAWEKRLAGQPVERHTMPDYGYYRIKTVDRTDWRLMSYWYGTTGQLCCLLDGKPIDETRALDMWPGASENAITFELYTRISAGEPWPDHNPIVAQSNRAPDDDSFEAIREWIDNLAREAERKIKLGAAQSQEQADDAANVVNKLAEYWKRADAKRSAEGAPHRKKVDSINETWRPVLGTAIIYQRLNQIVVAPWLAKLKADKVRREHEARLAAARAGDEARKAAVEAQRKREEAARTSNPDAAAEAEAHAAAAKQAEREAAFASQVATEVAQTTVTAGTQGRRRVGLRGRKIVTIQDRAAVLEYFKDRQEITDVLQDMAKKAAAAGITVPGVLVTEDHQAV